MIYEDIVGVSFSIVAGGIKFVFLFMVFDKLDERTILPQLVHWASIFLAQMFLICKKTSHYKFW